VNLKTIKNGTLLVLGSAAVGAIAVGFQRDTNLQQQLRFYQTQYRQAYTEVHPFIKDHGRSQNLGTDVFRACQGAYYSGCRVGSGETHESQDSVARIMQGKRGFSASGSGRYMLPQDNGSLTGWSFRA
jgi:hypothetical protein